jgi:hypothetical protein
MIATREQIEKANAQDFSLLVKLLSRFSRATNALAKMQTRVDKAQLDAVSRHAGKYARLQLMLAKMGEELEQLARQHPEWFPKEQRHVKTPSGKVSMHESTALVVENEDITLSLLDQKAKQDETFDTSLYINVKRSPNLNTLGTWTDEQLASVGIKREKKDNFKVEAATVKMDKALKAKPAKAAKGAK